MVSDSTYTSSIITQDSGCNSPYTTAECRTVTFDTTNQNPGTLKLRFLVTGSKWFANQDITFLLVCPSDLQFVAPDPLQLTS